MGLSAVLWVRPGPRFSVQMADGRWQMADGRWQMADGRWQMADGRWQMADGTAAHGTQAKERKIRSDFPSLSERRDARAQNVRRVR